MPSTLLCSLDAIADGAAKGFGDGTASSYFAIRKGDKAYVYQNCCPHAGAPLNWMPDRFLTMDRCQIICTSHGALFEIETGHCIAGPCKGEQLKSIATEIRDGQIWVL